jgi:hypothetical protein
MTVAALEHGALAIYHENGLEIGREMSFNDWKALGAALLDTQDRALWSIGDWWLYGQERFARDYHEGMAAIEASSRHIGPAARVARAFPRDRRRGQITFEMHEVLVGLPPEAQETWLDEVERQGWFRRQLTFALEDTGSFVTRSGRPPEPLGACRGVERYGPEGVGAGGARPRCAARTRRGARMKARNAPAPITDAGAAAKHLASRTVTPEGARQIAREEIASLCGLVLRRTQDKPGMATRTEIASIFGEALRDFTTEEEPGAAAD